MDSQLVELGQSLLMTVNVLLLAPVWWTLSRIYQKQDNQDKTLTSLTGKVAFIEGKLFSTLKGGK